jgi:hypothetical protein
MEMGRYTMDDLVGVERAEGTHLVLRRNSLWPQVMAAG